MTKTNIEEIIKRLESLEWRMHAKNAELLDGWPLDHEVRADEITLHEAIALLKSHPEAQPNEPLTLEELREMDGQPVWVVALDAEQQNETGWYLVNTDAAGSRFGTLETCFNELGLSDWDEQVLYIVADIKKHQGGKDHEETC